MINYKFALFINGIFMQRTLTKLKAMRIAHDRYLGLPFEVKPL